MAKLPDTVRITGMPIPLGVDKSQKMFYPQME